MDYVTHRKKPQSEGRGFLTLATGSGSGYLGTATNQMGSIIKNSYQIYKPDNFHQYPHLVPRRSFYAVGCFCGSIKSYPKPISTYPRALNLVTLLALCSDPFKGEGTYHIRLWSSHHAVGRGETITKVKQATLTAATNVM